MPEHDNCSNSNKSRILPKGQLSTVSLSLNFDTFKEASLFWNNFVKNANNSKAGDCIIHLDFGPQFWNSNFGQFTDKFGHMWQVSAPLHKDQKIPPNPFAADSKSNSKPVQKDSNNSNNNNSNIKANSKITGNKRKSMEESKNEELEQPAKKKQKLSNTNCNESETSGNTFDPRTGFKGIEKNVTFFCMDYTNTCIYIDLVGIDWNFRL